MKIGMRSARNQTLLEEKNRFTVRLWKKRHTETGAGSD